MWICFGGDLLVSDPSTIGRKLSTNEYEEEDDEDDEDDEDNEDNEDNEDDKDDEDDEGPPGRGYLLVAGIDPIQISPDGINPECHRLFLRILGRRLLMRASAHSTA